MTRPPIPLLFLFLAASCNYSHKELLEPPEEQAALRTMQTRAYDTTDEQATMRAVIATLQDLGFVIDDANAMLGIVSATKLEGGYVRIMVTVKRHGQKQTAVRASAQAGKMTIIDPGVYQQFFAALSKGMFLSAHEIE
jgi:hypothetical protein